MPGSSPPGLSSHFAASARLPGPRVCGGALSLSPTSGHGSHPEADSLSRAQLWAQMGSPRSGHGNAPRRKENSPASRSSGAPQQWATSAQFGVPPMGNAASWHTAATASLRRQGLRSPVCHPLRGCGDHVVTMNTGALRFLGTKGVLFTWLPSWIQTSNSCQAHQRDPGHCAASDDGMLRKHLHGRTRNR